MSTLEARPDGGVVSRVYESLRFVTFPVWDLWGPRPEQRAFDPGAWETTSEGHVRDDLRHTCQNHAKDSYRGTAFSPWCQCGRALRWTNEYDGCPWTKSPHQQRQRTTEEYNVVWVAVARVLHYLSGFSSKKKKWKIFICM